MPPEVRSTSSLMEQLAEAQNELDALEREYSTKRAKIHRRIGELHLALADTVEKREQEELEKDLKKDHFDDRQLSVPDQRQRHARGHGEQIVAILRKRPETPIHELVTAVYGENNKKNRQKTQSLLGYLANTKRVIRTVGVGRYVVAD